MKIVGAILKSLNRVYPLQRVLDWPWVYPLQRVRFCGENVPAKIKKKWRNRFILDSRRFGWDRWLGTPGTKGAGSKQHLKSRFWVPTAILKKSSDVIIWGLQYSLKGRTVSSENSM